jgi:lauroyl/myristoyl acyltransferase
MRDLYYLGHFLAAEGVGRLPDMRLRGAFIDFLARAAYGFSRTKRARIEHHIELAFGATLNPAQRKDIALACFREFWQEMADWVPKSSDRSLAAQTPIRGLEHLERALAAGNGAILWESNGFGRRVRGKQALHAHGVQLYQTHGATHLGVIDTTPEPGSWLRSRLLRGTYERRERAFVAEIVEIPLSATVSSGRVYLRHLRRNRALCMAGDGQIARKHYPVRLLGRTVWLAPGAVKLARVSGAPLLPMFWVPEGEGAPALEIDPPIDPPRAAAASADTDEAIVECLQTFADALERRVRRWPRAYRNWHLLGDGDPPPAARAVPGEDFT